MYARRRRLGAGPFVEYACPRAVHALAFVAGADAPLLVSGGGDGVLRAHDATRLAVEASISVVNSVLCLAADPEAKRVASAGGTGAQISDAGISIWDVDAAPAAPAEDFLSLLEEEEPKEKRARV